MGNNNRLCWQQIPKLVLRQFRTTPRCIAIHGSRDRRASANPAQILRSSMFAVLAVVAMPSLAFAAAEEAQKAQDAKAPQANASIAKRRADLTSQNADFELFLDRLMMAESSGRDTLKNSRSSALGPYQFIKGTFLYVTRRHFTERIAGLNRTQILALRTDRKFSRQVVAQYTRELAAHLARNGIATTYGNLRLAYLLGPSGATRVLQAKPTTPVRRLISRAAVVANPFLAAMTADQIIERANRDISMDRSKQLAVRLEKKKKSKGPRIKINCNLSRPSCRRWLALRKRKLAAQQRRRDRLNKRAAQ